MKYRKVVGLPLLVIPAFVSVASGIQLDVHSSGSIKSAAREVAGGLINHWFKGEQDAITAGFEVPAMWFWWEAGEIWTGLINYWSYTGDTTYLSITHQYLSSQIGSNQNYKLSTHTSDEENDDQAHWGFAAMTAAEKNLPQPNDSGPTWLQTVENLWNSQVIQWDTTACNGGLRWGIEAGDGKYEYKNSITNGAFFQLSARLALHTGDAKYAEWAEKSFNWARGVGLVTEDYHVLDGIHVATCKDFSEQRWSINHGIFLHGAAVMYKQTGSDVWREHTDGLLSAASAYYFNPPNAASAGPIMWEPDCERGNSCNNDMKIFKSSMARYMYETAAVAPHTSATIFTLLGNSAKGAANACTGDGGSLCGSKWYVADDGAYGPGSQLAALEVIQGLLLNAGMPAASGNAVRDTGSGLSSPEETAHMTVMDSFTSIDGMEPQTSQISQVPTMAEMGQGSGVEATTPISLETEKADSSTKAFSQENIPCTETTAMVLDSSTETSATTTSSDEILTGSIETSTTVPIEYSLTLTTTPTPSPACLHNQTSSFTTTNAATNAHHESDPSPSTKFQTKFSSDARTGPSFAMLVFCAALGLVAVIFT